MLYQTADDNKKGFKTLLLREEQAGKTSVKAKVVRRSRTADRTVSEILVGNTGNLPAFPVCIHSDESAPYYLSDNYFLLDVSEKRRIILTVMAEKGEYPENFNVSGWNFDAAVIE